MDWTVMIVHLAVLIIKENYNALSLNRNTPKKLLQ